MGNTNDILKKYIIKKYGGITKFLKKEKFSPRYLEIMLQKNDVFYEIGIGVKVCAVLNIDAKRLFCDGEIVETDKLENGAGEKPNENLSIDDIIKEKYASLDEDNRKKALDYANYIFENGIGGM